MSKAFQSALVLLANSGLSFVQQNPFPWGFQLQLVLIIPCETPKETLSQSLFMLLNRLPHPVSLPLSGRQACPLPCSPGESVQNASKFKHSQPPGSPWGRGWDYPVPQFDSHRKKDQADIGTRKSDAWAPQAGPPGALGWEVQCLSSSLVLLHLHPCAYVPRSAQALTSTFARATRSVPRPHLNVPFSRQYQESHFFPLSLQAI